jgi:hypothetical protein
MMTPLATLILVTPEPGRPLSDGPARIVTQLLEICSAGDNAYAMLARKGCPNRDWTVSSPSSSAAAGNVARLLPTATMAGKHRSGKLRTILLVLVVALFTVEYSRDLLVQRTDSSLWLNIYIKS